jgi:hypothetical protein
MLEWLFFRLPIILVNAASIVARLTVLLNAAAGCTPATKLLSEKSLKLILNCDALPNMSSPDLILSFIVSTAAPAEASA